MAKYDANWFSHYNKMINNPYVENLVAMGYDRADCETVAVLQELIRLSQ